MEDDKKTRVLIILITIVIIVIIALVIVFAIRYTRSTNSSSSVTGCDNLATPQNVIVLSQGITDINVSWNKVTNAASYKIYIGTVPGFNAANSINSYVTAQTTYIIKGQVLGRTYYIRVSAVNACDNESPLSPEKSVTLSFPPKFRIVSKEQPTLALTINYDSTVHVQPLCSGVGLDNLCLWQYDPTTGYVESVNNPAICMKTYPASVDLRVVTEPCSTISYYNFTYARQWNYDTGIGTLCNPQNPEGLNCVKINGPAIPGQTTVRVPYDGTSSMQWEIVEA